MKLLEKILAFFFPTRCILCGRAGSVNEDFLCPECEELPAERIYRYFSLHMRRWDYTLECRAPMQYKEPFRSTLWRFKFRSETRLAAPLAKRMKLSLDPDRTYDCIVPVPISRERKRERGYDQSELLAKALAEQIRIPCQALLEKTKNNRTQHHLTAKEREQNVRGVYSAKDCRGLRILLVDDIVTTGATARECARMLYRAGAEDVVCVCCAIVPK